MTPTLRGFGNLGVGDRTLHAAHDPSTEHFSASTLLGHYLDLLEGGSENNSESFARLLQSHANLRQAFATLPEARRNALRDRLSPALLQEILDLSSESDSVLLFEQMNSLGARLVQSHRSELALALFQTVSQTLEQPFPGRPATYAALSARARREADAILGRGAIGGRIEHLGRTLAEESSNPVMLASMGMAGLAFSTVRLGVLSRLLASPGEMFLTRGLGARALAATAGFAAEVPAFVFSGRGLNEALGVQQDWSARALGRDLASAGITLSFLKLGGAGANGLLAGNEGRTVFQRVSRVVLPQAAMLGGIMLGHRAEEGLGLRQHVDGATTLVDALSTLVQFHVSGRLLHEAMGPQLAAYQQGLEIQAEQLARTPRINGDRPPLVDVIRGMLSLGRPQLAGVGVELPHVFMMENNGEGGGNGNGGTTRPSSRPRVTPPERMTPRRPSPTPMEEALKAAADGGGKAGEIRISERPLALPEAKDLDDIDFDIVPEAPALPPPATQLSPQPAGPEIRETMMSGLPPAAAEPAGSVDPQVAAFLGKLVVGSRVGPEGRFQITGKVAEGGSGTVYRVIDRRGGRVAAIKVPKQGNNPQDLERFRREIWISENLASGWAVPIYDHFEIFPNSGIQVPLMEYVDGFTMGTVLYHFGLAETQYQQDYPLERRVEIFADLCLGVQDAHQHGITHNDLKPDNLMVDRNWRMRILDWGLARHVDEGRPNGPANISAEALRQKPPRITVSLGSGTPGYMAPETVRSEKISSPRSQDIFSLGVILYEMATGIHPFALFREKAAGGSGPRLVPERERGNPRGQIKLNPRSFFTYGSDVGVNPPEFRDILTGEHPGYLYELEGIARRAMHPNPKERFQSAGELREAVLLARANSDRETLSLTRARMEEAKAQLNASWKLFNVASQIEPTQWTKMHQIISGLRQDRESWHQGIEDLVTRLSQVMKYDPSPAARRMIAELSWERLVDGGDRMPASVRRALEARIRANDFPLREDGSLMFASVLNGRATLDLQLNALGKAGVLNPNLESNATLRVLRIHRDRDAQGHELGTYREGEELAHGSLAELNHRLALPHGYYVLELSAEGYAPSRIPLRISYEDVHEAVIVEAPRAIPVEMVQAAELGDDMVMVQGGKSFTGLDYYEDGMPSNIYSFPMHEIELPTFAISKKPVTVGEYIPFIEHLLSEGRVDEARLFMPRKNTPPQRISRDLLKDTWRVYRQEGFRAALEHFLNRQRGNTYYWKIRPQGFGPWRRYRLLDPTSHDDANGDPILPDQPISAISRKAAEAYLEWQSEREGRDYSQPVAEEKEKVDRNSFPWNFPWGYDFAPFYMISRLAFSGNLLNSTYPQPVGKHVMDQHLYRDFSIYGTLDNLGNVREYTASNGEPGYVVLSGGSVRVPYGPFYYPASRNYAHRETSVDDSVGAFRRVLRFGRPAPRETSSSAPPKPAR